MEDKLKLANQNGAISNTLEKGKCESPKSTNFVGGGERKFLQKVYQNIRQGEEIKKNQLQHSNVRCRIPWESQ